MCSRSVRLSVVLTCLCVLLAHAPRASAQVSAAISGVITDASAGIVQGAAVNARDVETGLQRGAMTDGTGRYQILALPVGKYEVRVTKDGFQEVLRGGIHLVVGQEAIVDFTLQVGAVQQRVTVTEEVPPVSVTTADISGLVGEEQVKDLPLNGRSFDLLMTLNPGVVNFTWEKTGALVGVSNSTTGNMFSVSGNRPQQNLFLLNGVEFTGAAENNMTPGGASGQLLGVEAVREFNILRDNYDAEYGKKQGGQVVIVTQSGTNDWHGSVYEFLRNNVFDARNFFDVGSSAPHFARNQFGTSIGGPIQKDKTFLFGNYEGFRQALDQTSVADVPSLATIGTITAGANSLPKALLNLWPVPLASDPQLKDPSGNLLGIQAHSGVAPQAIREDFGTTRLDHIFSGNDSASAIYTIDDSNSLTATPLNPYSSDIVDLREQVFSLQETHVVSPSIVNTARFGFSRAGYFFTGEPTPGTLAANVQPFLAGLPAKATGSSLVGAVVVGGSQAPNAPAQLGLAGSNNGSNLHIARNLFTYADQVSLIHGRHQITSGVWFQRLQSNEEIALSQYGQLTFTGITTLSSGTGTFLYDPTPTPLGWRSTFGAFFVQDMIRLSPRLTLSLGFRDEFSTGWNEEYGRAANYALNTSGVAQCVTPSTGTLCLPVVGTSLFSTNHATILPQPRIGVAWSPLGPKTVIRAGFGMYNDLQDALGYRADQNAPFDPTFTVAATNTTFSSGPISRAAAPSATALLVPGGVQPNMHTPTLESWSLRIEQQLSPNTSLSVGYVGNHAYHELIGVDDNAPQPFVCPASPCPAMFPNTAAYGDLANTPVPAGTFYIAPGTLKPNNAAASGFANNINNTWTWMSEGSSSYNALQVDLKRRFSGGLSLRGVYTWSKVLDDGDSYNATAAGNAPGLVSNPYDVRADWGLGTFDVKNAGVISATYALPFGHGKPWLGGANGVTGGLVSGWTFNSIVTLQSGFPFTPQLGYNPSNNGDTRFPVRPFVDPKFTGPVIVGTPSEWFNPNAFVAVPNNSGYFGNLGRDTLIGPGLATWDFSALKDTRIGEKLNLQFRAEIFNLLNRANFNTPNPLIAVLTAATGTLGTPSGVAGQILGTSTSSRQVQFGLKLLW